MLLAFVHPYGPQAPHPELCLIPAKPDMFSFPIRIESLVETTAAVYRLGPQEGLRVRFEAGEQAIILEPVPPTKLYLTPSQPDRPGFQVISAKVIVLGDRQYETFYLADAREGKWKKWMPMEYS